ncbi:hypothetical protein G7085_12805 [Tessaracoccus sp. HDW20]|uniref:hypothetical protein n=1 Tax=Tessaracoccus coleopterorum TaxID=2714950 RepID=UPI0018D444BF|nr:hypothetical protein [Tessaracoccus coleopterorum]NHB85205.1 hypothetical protein [Tessaracoccus coleopterorum]
MPLAAAETLIGIGARDAAVLDILDAPSDLGSVVVLIGGRLTLNGRDLNLNDITLAPGSLFGFRPYSTRDLGEKFPTTPPTFRSLPTPLAVADLAVGSFASYYY